jgi:hypothetical protein
MDAAPLIVGLVRFATGRVAGLAYQDVVRPPLYITIVKDYRPAGGSGLKRCAYRWCIRQGMLRQTLVKPSASSVV